MRGLDRWLIGDWEREREDGFLGQSERELHDVETCRPPCGMQCRCDCHFPEQIEDA